MSSNAIRARLEELKRLNALKAAEAAAAAAPLPPPPSAAPPAASSAVDQTVTVTMPSAPIAPLRPAVAAAPPAAPSAGVDASGFTIIGSMATQQQPQRSTAPAVDPDAVSFPLEETMSLAQAEVIHHRPVECTAEGRPITSAEIARAAVAAVMAWRKSNLPAAGASAGARRQREGSAAPGSSVTAAAEAPLEVIPFTSAYRAAAGDAPLGVLTPGVAPDRRRLRTVRRYEFDSKPLAGGVYGDVLLATRAAGGAHRQTAADGTTSTAPAAAPAGAVRKFALKRIKDEWLRTVDPRTNAPIGVPAYLLREIDLVSRMRHPNICGMEEVAAGDADVHGGRSDASSLNSSDATNRGVGAAAGTRHRNDVQLPVYRDEDGKPQHAHGASLGPLCAGLVPTVAPLRSTFYLVFPYVGENLRKVIYRRTLMRLATIKFILREIIRGLAFLHEHSILHRDLKPSNVVLRLPNRVQICDLGLGRTALRGQTDLSMNVVTLMYRAPEIFLGMKDYTGAVDVWSAGCIFLEMLGQQEPFPGADEGTYLAGVCGVLGIPTPELFPGFTLFPSARAALRNVRCPPADVALVRDNARAATAANAGAAAGGAFKRRTVPSPLLHRHITERRRAAAANARLDATEGVLTPAAMDLLQSLLQWAPEHRPTAAEALQHPFFTEGPEPCMDELCPPEMLASLAAANAAAAAAAAAARAAVHPASPIASFMGAAAAGGEFPHRSPAHTGMGMMQTPKAGMMSPAVGVGAPAAPALTLLRTLGTPSHQRAASIASSAAAGPGATPGLTSAAAAAPAATTTEDGTGATGQAATESESSDADVAPADATEEALAAVTLVAGGDDAEALPEEGHVLMQLHNGGNDDEMADAAAAAA